jgi:hypothetical protein
LEVSLFANTEKPKTRHELYADALKNLDDAIARAADLSPDLRVLGFRLEDKAAILQKRFATTQYRPL